MRKKIMNKIIKVRTKMLRRENHNNLKNEMNLCVILENIIDYLYLSKLIYFQNDGRYNQFLD